MRHRRLARRTLAPLTAALMILAAPAAHAAYAPLNAPGPALTIPKATLDAAIKCNGDLAHAKGEPVLLNPATGVTADQNYSWNYEPAFTAQGRAWCQVTMPQRTLGDIQTAAEYLTNAIRTVHARAGRKIAVMGHSQGGMSMRWVLRYWPDTRPMVDDVIGFAGSNHGTTALNALPCDRVGCTPASWQQGAASNFTKALNSLAETFPGISYTEIYSHTDEVVVPNANDRGSSSVHGGGGDITNVATQDVCPLDVFEHLTVGTVDPTAYALAIDALDHPGPASKPRIGTASCAQLYQPGVNPLNVNIALQLLAGAPGLGAVPLPFNVVGVPTPKTEPALRCYVFATCPQGSTAAATCLDAHGAAKGQALGPAALGRAPATQRKRLKAPRAAGRPGLDRYCIAGGGLLEIGYPTAKLSRAQRKAAKGHAVLLLSTSKQLTVSHIGPGARVATLRLSLKGEKQARIGRNLWLYVRRAHKATLIFKTRGSKVLAAGIAARSLTPTPAATRRLLGAWPL